jgi:hypothetical protein
MKEISHSNRRLLNGVHSRTATFNKLNNNKLLFLLLIFLKTVGLTEILYRDYNMCSIFSKAYDLNMFGTYAHTYLAGLYASFVRDVHRKESSSSSKTPIIFIRIMVCEIMKQT